MKHEAELPTTTLNPVLLIEHLDSAIRLRSEELKALEKAREILLVPNFLLPVPVAQAGNSTPTKSIRTAPRSSSEPPTIADRVETVLQTTGPVHVDELIKELKSRFNMKISSKNLVNTVNRWVARKRRFKRTAPNTFAMMG